MDRLLCFAAGSARGGDGVDDAGVLLVGFDGGAGAGNRVSASRFRAPRFAGGLCGGSGGHRADALGSVIAGRDWRSADYGLSFATLYPITVAAFAALRRRRPQHWRDHVFAGSGGTGRSSVDGGCDLARHWESARRAAAPLAATVILFVIHLFDW